MREMLSHTLILSITLRMRRRRISVAKSSNVKSLIPARLTEFTRRRGSMYSARDLEVSDPFEPTRIGLDRELGELAHVRQSLAIAPSVNQFAGIRRRGELLDRFHLDATGPGIRFALDKDYIRRRDCDHVKDAERARRARARIAERFEKLD